MITHWTYFLDDQAEPIKKEGQTQAQRLERIKRLENELKLLKSAYEEEEIRINRQAHKNWPLSQINRAKFKAFQNQ